MGPDFSAARRAGKPASPTARGFWERPLLSSSRPAQSKGQSLPALKAGLRSRASPPLPFPTTAPPTDTPLAGLGDTVCHDSGSQGVVLVRPPSWRPLPSA